MEHLHSTFLFEARIGLSAPLVVGATPEGHRAIYHVTGGELSGPKIKGKYLPSGGEWARIRPDGSLAIDVRCCVETDEGALIYVTYQGRLVVPAELQAQVFDMTAPDRPPPSTYYFRVAPLFETANEKYAWLNGIQAVGVGEVVQGGVAYRVYAID
jgi:Protein of unknown function (DUF3237)